MTSLAENLIPLKNLRPPQTRYLKSVKPPRPNMLKRGKQNAKLGDKVTVKMWKGMTIYSLTLEERATCPSDCEQWDNCYGDNMPFGHRFNHTDPQFWSHLHTALDQLNTKHQNGFIVRLHVLGDFVDIDYIERWLSCLEHYPNLHVFGYTHHRLNSELGRRINSGNKWMFERWRIRFSDDLNTEFSAHVASDTTTTGGIMCPEQQGWTDSCATCGYCWTSENPVVFIEH